MITSALQFFYEQPVCKQPALDIQNNKQILVIKILSISNRLKVETKNGKK